MRASLLQPLAKRRRPRRQADKPPVLALRSPDLAVQRVRRAGGPVDRALYTCECGYLFLAQVSTTVACPHCSSPQAW